MITSNITPTPVGESLDLKTSFTYDSFKKLVNELKTSCTKEIQKTTTKVHKDLNSESCIKAILFSDRVSLESNRGITKEISISDYVTTLLTLVDLDARNETFQLPFGTFRFGSMSDGGKSLDCYFPETRKTITHTDTYGKDSTVTSHEIPFPNTILSFTLRENNDTSNGKFKVTSVKYFITKDSPTKLQDNISFSERISSLSAKGLYLMPFTNFYNDGRMCYGNNTMPILFNYNLRGLEYYYQVIFSSPFNNDMGIKANAVKGLSRDSPKKFYESLATFEKFPYECLR